MKNWEFISQQYPSAAAVTGEIFQMTQTEGRWLSAAEEISWAAVLINCPGAAVLKKILVLLEPVWPKALATS
jgi:hypothetical protein